MSKIYTHTGDEGTTGLPKGRRVPKDSLRIEVLGTLDELNSMLGTAASFGLDLELQKTLKALQDDLIALSVDLSNEKNMADQKKAENLEGLIDTMSADLEPLKKFILPGGTQGAGLLHLARTVCRRAERRLVSLSRQEKVDSTALKYLNRLSDCLFIMARLENKKKGMAESSAD